MPTESKHEERESEAPAEGQGTSVIAWAEQKKLLPQYGRNGRLNPNYWKFEAVKASMRAKGWQDDDLATEAEFEEALRSVEGHVYR